MQDINDKCQNSNDKLILNVLKKRNMIFNNLTFGFNLDFVIGHLTLNYKGLNICL
jgi:hypothetical protein